jgi:GTPase
MRFIDEVVVHVCAGAGGNGCLAFRREKHVPLGGPAGGDGGDGADIILVADPALTTLLDLRYQRHYKGQHGRHGQGHDRDGRCAENAVVRVPCGTLVFDRETSQQLADLVDPGQRFVAAKGGRGGRGNRRFVSSTNRAPRRADPGEPGEERDLRLELKLLADIGLVGLPNAGKSTLIARISAARPKIADYPFTTLVPNLGMVRMSDERSFVVADIPGLIEGASEGAGLGHRFLRHIERTAILIYLVDDRHALLEQPGSPAEDLAILSHELTAHAEQMGQRPALVALNKTDLLTPERERELMSSLQSAKLPVLSISAATGAGVDKLLERCWQELHPVSEP